MVRGQRSEVRGQVSCFLLSSVICCLLSVFCLLSSACSAQPISSSELIKNARQHDGRYVTYEGELIGSILKRGDHAWLNLHDGENAISVWAPVSLISSVQYAGGYKQRGDELLCSGLFNRACISHGGALDLHATELSVLRRGAAVSEVLDHRKIFIIFLLLGVLACLMIVHILRKKRLGK